MGLSAQVARPGAAQQRTQPAVRRASMALVPAGAAPPPAPEQADSAGRPPAPPLSSWHRTQPAAAGRRGRLPALALTIGAHLGAFALVLTAGGLVVDKAPEPLTTVVLNAPPAPIDMPAPMPVAAPNLTTAPPPPMLLPVPKVTIDRPPPPTHFSLPPSTPVAAASTVAASPGPAGQAAAGPAGGSTSAAAASASYESRLLAHLLQYKRYPRAAVKTKLQGVAWVRVRFDRQGRVLSATLEHSSGRGILDDEALELMSRAAPFPAVPDEIQGSALERVVPVEFKLT